MNGSANPRRNRTATKRAPAPAPATATPMNAKSPCVRDPEAKGCGGDRRRTAGPGPVRLLLLRRLRIRPRESRRRRCGKARERERCRREREMPSCGGTEADIMPGLSLRLCNLCATATPMNASSPCVRDPVGERLREPECELYATLRRRLRRRREETHDAFLPAPSYCGAEPP